jgi:hypothetical protein
MQKKINIDSRHKQYKHEHNTWLRMLDYFQFENNQMKNRLAEILKSDIDNALLDKLEYYQTDFLNKDAIILLLHRDIVNLGELIAAINDAGSVMTDIVQKKQSRLRDEMQKIENDFNLLKHDFNNYLSAML